MVSRPRPAPPRAPAASHFRGEIDRAEAQGVSRADMTREYFRAVEDQKLSYNDLKRMARESLEHSFLPGESLWTETKYQFKPVAVCAALKKDSAACQKFLADSPRARQQWELEMKLRNFESRYASIVANPPASKKIQAAEGRQ